MPKAFHLRSVKATEVRTICPVLNRQAHCGIWIAKSCVRRPWKLGRMSDAAGNDDDRQFWLRIADGWSKLALDAGRK
jgi:hypothetical protein